MHADSGERGTELVLCNPPVSKLEKLESSLRRKDISQKKTEKIGLKGSTASTDRNGANKQARID